MRRQLGRYRFALGLSAAAIVAVSALAFYATVLRARADRANVQLQRELATSTIERGRLLALTGNLPIAEDLVWRELFRQPTSLHAQWTLWDIYSREATLWARMFPAEGAQTVRFSPDRRLMLVGGRVESNIRLI